MVSASKAPMKPCAALGGSPHDEFHLVVALVFRFLVADVRSNDVLVQPYRGNEVPPGPEVLAGEIFLAASELARNLDRALPRQLSNHVRDRVFGRNAQAHVHMVAHHVSLHDRGLLV